MLHSSFILITFGAKGEPLPGIGWYVCNHGAYAHNNMVAVDRFLIFICISPSSLTATWQLYRENYCMIGKLELGHITILGQVMTNKNTSHM